MRSFVPGTEACMSTATPIPDDVDPATLDIVTPEKYERDGYPHAEWTWLRKNDPVHWYESDFCDPFWAITKHADIVAIGKNPTDWIIEPRLAVFTREVPPEPTSRHLLTGLRRGPSRSGSPRSRG
jgi:hypothetical protein